jgi:23S rRNA pseudouridine1911/1915/1917 synthase
VSGAAGGSLDFVAGDDASDTRLDVYLAAAVSSLSRSAARRSIDAGDVLVDGEVAKASLKLKGGERIEIDLPTPPPTDVAPEPIELAIVYEDDEIAVVDKPAGLVVHPGAGVSSGTLANALAYRYRGATAGPASRPGIVHRLDKETSGLLVVARTEAALVALAEQFASRSVTKRYLALVYGVVAAESATLEKPIGRDPRVRVRMAVAPPGRGRPALTRYRVLERFAETTYLDVEILTGRTHQIRVHLANAGRPVVGDETYAPKRAKALRDARLRRKIEELGRQFLHAASLEIGHPRTGERLRFTAPLPPKLDALLEYCRAHDR